MTSTGAGTHPTRSPHLQSSSTLHTGVFGALNQPRQEEETMTTDETPVMAFRRARKHHRSAWGHPVGTVRVVVPAREPVGVITDSERTAGR